MSQSALDVHTHPLAEASAHPYVGKYLRSRPPTGPARHWNGMRSDLRQRAVDDSSLPSDSTKSTSSGAVVEKQFPKHWKKAVGGSLLAAVALAVPNGPAQAKSLIDYFTGPLYEPIRQDSPYWLRNIVWNDFRLAVLFFVAAPLVIWIWSLVEQTGKNDAIKRIMFGYWQAASLLMWTVYLQIGSEPLSFATAASVQVLIPVVLWWWKDLSEEVSRDSSTLAKTFRNWRLIATVLAVIGGLTQIFTTQVACTVLSDAAAVLESPTCAAWLEPPWGYKNLIHPGIPADQLQIIGQVGTLIFIANFILYITTSLPRTGRTARSNKSLSYIVLAKLGFYKS